MSRKQHVSDEDRIEPIGAFKLNEPETATAVSSPPRPQTVKPFVGPAEGTAVNMPEAVAPPLNLYRVNLAKNGFPGLDTELDRRGHIAAADEKDAKKKFFERHNIVACEKEPEITLLGQA